MRLIVGISGASGAQLGIKFLASIPQEIEKYCIISKGAQKTLEEEGTGEEEKINSILQNIKNLRLLDNENLGECVASGSFMCEAMAVIPCSQNTLAKIACGICDNLLLRAASVMLKENRKLLLAPREMPLSAIVLENMLKLSRLGVIIAPPILGYYAGNCTEDIANLLIGKWCDILKIPYDYPRWH